MPLMREIEYRSSSQMLLETRENAAAVLTGYASTFDEPYEIDGVTETIKRGAFSSTLEGAPDVFAFLNHDTGRIIARTITGSLKLSVDEKGLQTEICPIDTADGRTAIELVRTGTVTSMSFGFCVDDDTIEMRNGKLFRDILKISLHEVSIVAFPANNKAVISMRCKNQIDSMLAKKSKVFISNWVNPLANIKKA